MTQQTTANKTSDKSAMTMDQLMASFSKKPVILNRGDEVEGKIAAISESDLILDLGTKSEGVINKKEFSSAQLETLKVGSSVKAFVMVPENESGQTILTLYESSTEKQNPEKAKRMQRFTQALNQNQKISGEIVEINKGGLLVEANGIRGFLPVSQIGLEALEILSKGIDASSGKKINLSVLEVDANNNRLIFGTSGNLGATVQNHLDSIALGQKIKSEIVVVLPFGLVVNLSSLGDGLTGIVSNQEVAWERVEDLATNFKVGDPIEVIVSSIDKNSGRINLSLKQLSEDPFVKLAENFQADDVVKGIVRGTNDNGVEIELEGGVVGLLPADKTEGNKYEVGQTTNFLVDNVDKNRRKINLAPFITSTKGLIYK